MQAGPVRPLATDTVATVNSNHSNQKSGKRPKQAVSRSWHLLMACPDWRVNREVLERDSSRGWARFESHRREQTPQSGASMACQDHSPLEEHLFGEAFLGLSGLPSPLPLPKVSETSVLRHQAPLAAA